MVNRTEISPGERKVFAVFWFSKGRSLSASDASVTDGSDPLELVGVMPGIFSDPIQDYIDR